MRKTILILCAAVLCSMLFLPLGVSADFSSCWDALASSSTRLATAQSYPYYLAFHGVKPDGSESMVVIYYDDIPTVSKGYITGGSAYMIGFGTSFSTYSKSSGAIKFVESDTDPYVYPCSISFGLYSTTNRYALHSVVSNFAIDWALFYDDFDLAAIMTGSNSSGSCRAVEYDSSITIDQAAALYTTPEDTTDPTESTAAVGGIPDEWISGGETLPETEPFELPSELDYDNLIQEFETVDMTLDSNYLNALGGFWAIFDLFIASTDLMWVVLLSMSVTLIAWFLGRRV